MDDSSNGATGAPQARNVGAGGSGPKRVKTLRATDVMPPFDAKAANQVGATVRPSEGPALMVGEIPKYDLAENILAEQRRVAAGRRRSPGRAVLAQEPVSTSASPEPQRNGAKLSPEPMSGTLAELQRIVTEIVARDIERLCRRPDQGR